MLCLEHTQATPELRTLFKHADSLAEKVDSLTGKVFARKSSKARATVAHAATGSTAHDESAIVAAVRSDEQLMKAYVEGDTAAFRELFERYGPILLNLTRRHLPSEEEAREVVQQTFFQLHVARADFRLDARLKPWIFTIAMNLVRQYYRRKNRRKESDVDAVPQHLVAENPDAAHGLQNAARAAKLREALSQLSDGQRDVIELHWFQDKPFAEVADLVGASEGTVRVRAHRAYNRLKELLGEEFLPGGGGSQL